MRGADSVCVGDVGPLEAVGVESADESAGPSCQAMTDRPASARPARTARGASLSRLMLSTTADQSEASGAREGESANDAECGHQV